MLLKRPQELELTINPAADYSTTLIALAFAALKQSKTTISRIERTNLVAEMEEFLCSGGVQCTWDERTVTIDPSTAKPFESYKAPSNYELLKVILALAATRAGSRLAVTDNVDETLQILVLALRRLGAELEFVAGEPDFLLVHKPVCTGIKYHLKKESAKITPELALAMASTGNRCEISDLFETDRFDYLYNHYISDFQRVNLAETIPEDELERRLRKSNPITREYNSRLIIDGTINDVDSQIELRPDVEFTAYLAAGIVNHPQGKLILKGFNNNDFATGPLNQLKRMGAKFTQTVDNNEKSFIFESTTLQPRKVTYEQLHSYPDSIGALALASSRSDGTSVIRSSPYNTRREEETRRRICLTIRSLGVKVAEIKDGVVLEGNDDLNAQPIDADSDPFCALMAVAASLGTVEQVEIDNLDSARSRWGESFTSLLSQFK